jgi:hypothetical protein
VARIPVTKPGALLNYEHVGRTVIATRGPIEI